MAKILVVDESEQTRRLIRGWLEGGQHQLLEADGEREALGIARGGRPDLIIVGIIMPTMDGTEFIRLLTAEAGYPKARIVLSAAEHLAREARVLAEACGIRHVAVTPLDPAVFRRLVDSALACIEEPNPVAEAHPTANPDAGSVGISPKLTALIELNEGKVAAQDAGQIVAEICRRARYVVGSKWACAGLLSEGYRRLRAFDVSGLNREFSDRSHWPSASTGVLRTIVKEQRSVRSTTPDGNPGASGLPAWFPPVHSFLASPIAVHRSVYGWIFLANKFGESGFDEQDERLSRLLGAQAAIAYESAMQRRAARPRRNWAEREAFAKKYGQESVRKLAAILESSEDAIISMTPEGIITDWNGAAQRLYEYSREEAIGRHFLTLYPRELWSRIASELELLNQGRRLRAIEMSHFRKSGETLSLSVTLSPMNNKEDTVVGISSFAREIGTSGKREEPSAPWDRRFRQFAENSNDVFWMYDPRTDRTLYVSPAFREVWGRSCEDLIRSGDSHLDAVHPDDRSRLLSLTENQIKGERTDEEYRVVRPDGSVAWVRDRTFTIKDGSGKASFIAGIASDITHRKQLEEQLLRSQKMEAVGRLAGGIAHDFNNLLTAILGYSQLALSRLREDDPMFKYVEEIRKAGHRASQLTSHLLAFSRKQVLQPKVLDLNSVISDIQKLLRRLIGEDIDLRVKLDPNLGFVKVDRGQIDQVIMNLAVNARDAMPRGGEIVISTANVELDAGYASGHVDVKPGKYVAVTVSDSGIGMDKKTMTQAFDPFFTTKEQGKGTGLGLSTVYGIVSQSGGHIWLYSEPGVGTTFKVYLPIVEEAVEAQKSAPANVTLARGSETILLVEDEPMVRDLASLVLRDQGFTLLEARNGEEAIKLAANHQGKIHLLLTDVVMPGIGGRELSERVKAARPDIKVLFYSGYTDDAIVQHGMVDAGTPFLEKPFTRAGLLLKVRQVLDSATDKPAGSYHNESN